MAAKMILTVEETAELLRTYQPNPSAFVIDILQCQLWRMQEDVIEAVFKYPAVAVKTCNAAGKSYLAARAALAFLTLKPGSIVVTTAPTWRQVKDVLWRELGSAYEMSVIQLSSKDPTQVGLEYAKDWYAVGLSTKDSEKFFGYHADEILVIVDEASGVQEAIYVGVDAITPNANAHTLFIGNPTDATGRFGRAFKDPLVKQFTISAFDTPNFTANGISSVEQLQALFEPPAGVEAIEHAQQVQKTLRLPYPALISPFNAYRRLQEWGVESPFWQALIMGEFPNQSEFSLIPMNLIMQSMEHDDFEELGWVIPHGPLEIGGDIARYGMDRTVMIPRRGGWVEQPMAWSKQDTQVTTDRIVMIIDPTDPHTVLKIDDTGVGGGVTDALIRRRNERTGEQAQWLYQVLGINFGSSAGDPDRFVNMRAEMFWNLREQFMGKKIALPKDMELANELASIRFKINPKGKIEIEAKDEIKKRNGKSPDKADALALAFAKARQGNWDDVTPEPTPKPGEPNDRGQWDEESAGQPVTAGLSGKTF